MRSAITFAKLAIDPVGSNPQIRSGEQILVTLMGVNSSTVTLEELVCV